MTNSNVITISMKWKFKVEIRPSVYYPTGRKGKPVIRHYAVIKSKNGEVVFTGEVRNRKSALIKTINNLFPGVKITEKPYQPSTKKPKKRLPEL